MSNIEICNFSRKIVSNQFIKTKHADGKFYFYSCRNATNNQTHDSGICYYDYNGQGLEYQIVAGPAFTVIYTFGGIFISYIAEKYNRKAMLAICLMFWSVMTLLTGFVKEYWQLVILRFGLGFGCVHCNF